MKTIAKLEKNRSFWFLLIISFVFFLLRWPSLFEPYWYGDEGIYQAVGMLIRAGEPLYSGAWDNKPPLLYLLYAIFNSDQFLLRAASLVFGLVSVWLFYFLSKELFKGQNKIVLVLTTIYALIFGTRTIEGNIANSENFMLLPIVASAYLLIKTHSIKKLWQFKSYFIAGVILSLAFLIKIVAVFDFLAFSAFLFIDKEDQTKKNLIEKVIPFVVGFLAPVIGTSFYYLLTNNFKDFLDAFVFSNIGYVGYGNKFIIPQGLLYLKTILLSGFVGFLYFRRKSIPREVLFVYLWFSFSLFNAFFSQRPYTHYLLVLLPSFCLMIGAIIYEKRTRAFSLIFFAISFLLINNSFTFKGKFISYYKNLISFCSNKKDVSAYQSFFDGNTPRDYELSKYIKMNTGESDSIFIWGNNAQVYKLSDKTPIMRYTVAYHITQYESGTEEMRKAIEAKKPKLIIVMPNVPAYPLPLTEYNERITIRDAVVYERVL